MTPLSTLLSFFPALVMLMAAASFLWICIAPGFANVAALVVCLYGLPLLVYHIHRYFYPIEEGISYLIGEKYSPWWGSHQIQVIYIAFPALETLLRLIPGAFSAWLRLWGAQVGRDVYWSPGLAIADRGLIEIGDRSIIGYGVQISSHVIKPKKENLVLYVKKVKIGSNVFLGSASRMGPGVVIEDGAFVPVTTDLFPNKKLS